MMDYPFGVPVITCFYTLIVIWGEKIRLFLESIGFKQVVGIVKDFEKGRAGKSGGAEGRTTVTGFISIF